MAGCIVGSQYIPSAEYFAHWVHHGLLTLEIQEHYPKRTWRNKTAILGPDKPLELTVPLRKGKHQQMKITDVLISFDEPWPKMHLYSLKTVYGKTAFFDEILPGLEDIYNHVPETLWEFNLCLIRYVTSLIPGQWKTGFTETYLISYPDSVIDLRKGVSSGKSSLEWDPDLSYDQVQRLRREHQPNLCILDALCHLGPDTSDYLAKYAEKLYKAAS